MSRSAHPLRISACNESNGNSWLERSRYWLGHGDDDVRPFSRSRKIREPLIISGHGARLWINNGCLLVRSGFTHFPQKVEQHRYFPNDPKRPSRIIVIDGSGVFSFSALDWLLRNNVPLIRLNWRGEAHCIIGIASRANDLLKKMRQAKNKSYQLDIASKLIIEKIRNSCTTLKSAIPHSKVRAQALLNLKSYLARVGSGKIKSIPQLMGIEGGAALAYFSAWQGLPIKWTGTKRKPIPVDWHQIGLRSSITRQKIKNRNASHPINAILNYAYAVLESQVRIQIISNGQNPEAGVLHRSRPDRDALVLDLMEPFRPIIDRKVLEFIRSNTFAPNDFEIRPDGVCRLHPTMASTVVKMVSCASS